MKVYLTGVNAIKTPKSHIIDSPSPKHNKQKEHDANRENDDIKEESISLESDKKAFPQNNINFTHSKNKFNFIQKNISNEGKNSININLKNSKNNFISKEEDQNKKRKKIFKCQKDFNKTREQNLENKKINEIISNELKEEYLEYIMLKEPKYADFDKISDDYRNKIYQNYKKYNNNLIIISQKKQEHKKLLFEMEKSLINNYYVKDSSMLPIYEKLIEKLKIDILTKQQEHDGYKKQYDELYNQNCAIKRKVLDEIDIDRVNEDFYDQYKLLKIHAIVQVSKKQNTLNQIEDYHKKVLDEHEKEIKQKNKILKELKLEIEVFKEDEKDLVHKLKKLKAKREQVKVVIKETENKLKIYENHYLRYVRRYFKSFISMNRIFKSVNAKNLDDVLLDVNSINARFNNLKNKIIKLNQDISNLNSIYSQLNKNYINIQQQILSNKTKKNNKFKEKDQNLIIEINNLSKKEKEEQNKILEIIQNNIGIFQNGITFIFEKIKLLVLNIKILKNIISPKLYNLVYKYKNMPYKIDYEIIDKKFFKNYSFLFIQYSNILFYLSLRSMCSGININDENFNINIGGKKAINIIHIFDKTSLSIYQDGVKKTLKEYKHRSMLKLEKQKEINEKTKQKELEEKIDNQLMAENKAITQKQMYKRFIEYLHNKESQNNNSTKNEQQTNTRKNNSKKNSFFFTGIDSIKSQSKILGSSTSSSMNYDDTTSKIGGNKPKEKKIAISLRQKEEFLDKNKNKLISIFSKYQNTLVRENDKNLYFQKKTLKTLKKLKKSKSEFSPNLKIKKKYGGRLGINENKKKATSLEEDSSSKRTPIRNLLDENYEYDEEENYDLIKKNNLYHKKNDIKNYYSFFRLNKDRASIYKKMNDLRKLQMSYFGGRFLNTKINNGPSTSGENNLDDFINNYYKKQTHEQFYNSKKNRLLNYNKKAVADISANKKFRNKTPNLGRNKKNNKKDNCFSAEGSRRLNFKKINSLTNADIKSKTLFLINNNKATLTGHKTQKIIDKIKLSSFPKSPNKYRTFSPNNYNKK